MNRNGQKLTRAGVTYILNKYAKAASVIDPSIPEKIPPHLMRHTKAMHIYDADNDLVHVRDFLGHSDIKTTDIYPNIGKQRIWVVYSIQYRCKMSFYYRERRHN